MNYRSIHIYTAHRETFVISLKVKAADSSDTKGLLLIFLDLLLLRTPLMSPKTVKLQEENFPFHLTRVIASISGQSVSHSEQVFLF